MIKKALILEFDRINMISEETRLKMRNARLGKTAPRKGKTKYNIIYNDKNEYQREVNKITGFKTKWYQTHRDESLLRAKIYRESHKEEIVKIKHICYERRKNEISNSGKKYYLKIRNELFDILGGKECMNCGFDVVEALQFDHVNGGGIKDRKSFSSNKLMYLYYIKNPEIAKQKLQVLCANCNFIKHLSNNEVKYNGE